MAEAPDPDSQEPTGGLVTRPGIRALQPEDDFDQEKSTPVVQDDCADNNAPYKDTHAEDVPVEDQGARVASSSTTKKASGRFGELEFPDEEVRLVLLGKTGNGKSSTGNTILNKEPFKVEYSMSSVTSCTQGESTKMFGIRLKVVDTPGLFDTDRTQDQTISEICKCVGLTTPGPHALLFVIRLDAKYTKEENEALNLVREQFGDAIMKHVVIVFTHGDKHEGVAVDLLLEKSPAELKALLQEVNQRYVVFNNKADFEDQKRHDQVKKLLNVVTEMLKDTGGTYFSNPFLQQVEARLWKTGKKFAERLGFDYKDDRIRDLVLICVQDVEKDKAELEKKLDAAMIEIKRASCKISDLAKEMSKQCDKEKDAIDEQKNLQEKLVKAQNDLVRLNSVDEEKNKVQEEIECLKRKIEEKKTQEQNASEQIKTLGDQLQRSEEELKRVETENNKQQAIVNTLIEDIIAMHTKSKEDLTKALMLRRLIPTLILESMRPNNCVIL